MWMVDASLCQLETLIDGYCAALSTYGLIEPAPR